MSSPVNVLLEGERVVPADFGIAAVEGGIATNQVVGSPQYLAPERFNGHPAGPPSDLWGLGVTLYVALTGESPFRRDDVVAVLELVTKARMPRWLVVSVMVVDVLIAAVILWVAWPA